MATNNCDLCVTVNPWKTVDTFQIIFEGTPYDVAVCSRHLAVLQTLFAPVFDASQNKPNTRNVVKAAAPVKSVAKPAVGKKSTVAKKTVAKKADGGVTPAQIREWAHSQGMTNVPQRGRIGAELEAAYQAAHAGK